MYNTLLDSEPYNLNFSNREEALKQLSALGFTCTRSGATGYEYRPSEQKFVAVAANTFRFSGHLGHRVGLVVEQAQTNVVPYSSEDHASWLETGSPTVATATSVIDGKSAIKITASSGASAIYKNVGTFTGNTETYMTIVEEQDAGQYTVTIFNATGASTVCAVELDFGTGDTTVNTGTASRHGAVKLADSGPNGGALYLMYIQYSSTAGNTRRPIIYADTESLNTGTMIVHHVQITEDDVVGSPIVTGSGSVTRNLDAIVSTSVPTFLSDHNYSCFAKAGTLTSPADGVGMAIFSTNDAVGNDFHAFGMVGSTGARALSTTYLSGVNKDGASSSTITPSGDMSFADANTGVTNLCYGEGQKGAAATGSLPATATRMDIGCNIGASCWNGIIYSLRLLDGDLAEADYAAEGA